MYRKSLTVRSGMLVVGMVLSATILARATDLINGSTAADADSDGNIGLQEAIAKPSKATTRGRTDVAKSATFYNDYAAFVAALNTLEQVDFDDVVAPSTPPATPEGDRYGPLGIRFGPGVSILDWDGYGALLPSSSSPNVALPSATSPWDGVISIEFDSPVRAVGAYDVGTVGCGLRVFSVGGDLLGEFLIDGDNTATQVSTFGGVVFEKAEIARVEFYGAVTPGAVAIDDLVWEPAESCPLTFALSPSARGFEVPLLDDLIGKSDLYRFRDEVLSRTELGRAYTDLYYQHAAEVTQLLKRNPRLALKVATSVASGLPYVRRVLSGERRAPDRNMLNDIIAVSRALRPDASAELGNALDRLERDIRNGSISSLVCSEPTLRASRDN